MRFFYALHLVHEGMGLIIGYLSLVSLHFFHPITLAYVTSRVLRPPWRHEIRRYLWQSSLRQAFVDWLKYSCYHVLFMEDTFGSIWSLSYLTYWCLMDFWVWRQFIDDIGFILLSTSDIHTGAFSPFIRLRWAPSGALSLSLGFFHWSEIPSRVCLDDISSSGALLSLLTGFMILGSICGVFLR